MAALLDISTPLADDQARALERAFGAFPSTWRLTVKPHAIGAFRVSVQGPGYSAACTFEQDCSAGALAGFLKVIERYAQF